MSSVPTIARPSLARSVLFVCDIQETFRSLVPNMPSVMATAQFLLGFANAADMPVVVTEQYPKAFGATIAELAVPAPGDSDGNIHNFAKTRFSMLVPEVESVLESTGRDDVILCGLESHICVQQTALDLRQSGRNVFVLADGVGSQAPYDREIAIERMRDAGAVITTAQSLVYDLLGDAKSPHFKAALPLVKAHADATSA